MTKETVHHPTTVVNTPTPRPHHTGPQAWVELHADDLLADWQHVVNKEPTNLIDPLR